MAKMTLKKNNVYDILFLILFSIAKKSKFNVTELHNILNI